MSIMNSTVSHEMRNPLNAIVSQIDKQRSSVAELKAFVLGLDLAKPQLDAFSKIEASFANSLQVSESSSNLIRFNVEDILALPQLKAGKFTKNIREHDVAKGVEEVVSIMEHQAKVKKVQMVQKFEGFETTMVPIDL
mmetsp:Transcript_41749/g.63769  ORF Transcript_41749/g.63769 Transcript_41749/m.63769 type:complete len:137 (-) Transcript_41749:742-1152(-)